MIGKMSAAFTGGAIGGFVDSVNIWMMGKSGISDMIGLTMKPAFTAPWLYQRMVWGGLWMLLLMLPFCGKGFFCVGCLLSLLPSTMMLFFGPTRDARGFWPGFGMVTPFVVIGLNCIYGMVALWYREGMA